MNNEKVMIIDGNSIMNRAFYGLQGAKLLATKDGQYTNALFGFLNILNKYLEEEKPQYICVAFDLKAPTFRHKEFEGYKAKRKGMPPELASQMPVIKEILDAMHIQRLEYEGFEADDIIGHVSACAEKLGLSNIIVTGDRDSLQLASDLTRIKLPVTKGGKTETEEYDEKAVMERYGVTPTQFIDVKGLMGDTSDNIPGVPGIGEKTALELIKEFGSIEEIYCNIESVQKKSVKEKLENNRELAFMSKRLATIDRGTLTICPVEEMKIQPFDNEKVYELFKRLEFKSFIDKFKLNVCMENAEPIQQAKIEFKIIDSVSELKELVLELNKAQAISFFQLLDEQENGLSLVGLAVTNEKSETYFIKIKDGVGEEYLMEAFKTILENPSIKKYGHDLKDFIVFLKNQSINLSGLAFDTKIAAYILEPTRDTYTIAELAHQYANYEIEDIEILCGKGKSFVPYGQMETPMLSKVASAHSIAVLKVRNAIDAIIKDNNQQQLYYEVELPLVEVLADMEHHGFKVNTEELKLFSAELEKGINALTERIYYLAGEKFNINSTKQLGVILFEKLGLPVQKKTKTGYSTDAEVLEQLCSRHEIVEEILEYRQLVKLKSTYVEGLLNVINPNTGKIHSSFNQTVTATGRISSTEPNLQNIPIKLEMGRKIRKVFVPENESWLLLDADYSQIELRVLAHITGDENMIKAFMEDADIHTATASQIFDVAPEDVTSTMRSRAKTVNFGIVYGIGDFSLSKDLGITRKEAKKYIEGYLDKYPKVREYMHNIVKQGKEAGFVSTILNRRRYLPELASSNFNIRSFGERVAMNTPIQGSAADIIKIAMVKVYNALKENNLKSRLILQVHDELIIETVQQEKDCVAKILKECMEKAVELRVPLKVDVNEGHNWYESK